MACVLYDFTCKKCNYHALERLRVDQCPVCGSDTYVVKEWDEHQDHNDD